MENPGPPATLSIRSQVNRLTRLTPETWAKDNDLEGAIKEHKAKKRTWAAFWGLTYRAIGVIYGDLGTSPLYTYPSIFSSPPSRLAVYGSCSLIIWIMLLQLIVKYVFITLYADDEGEGGTFAVYSLLCRHIGITPFGKIDSSDESLSRYSRGNGPRLQTRASRIGGYIKSRPRAQLLLLLLVLFGTSMLIGDGVLTCAIEVTSAVSGLELKAQVGQGVVVGVSCTILVLLFSLQRLGTSRIGTIFSPILITWFLSNAALGLYNIVRHHPGMLAAFNPAYAFRYLVHDGREAWLSLGGIILCVTGAEAMFSDLGHFSRPAVQFNTLVIVLPACLLTYLGEAAYLIRFPEQFSNPYFAAVPSNLFWPMFVVATAASVVAAQSLITATFSIVKQSMSLNCFPAVQVVQTSSLVSGQVYLPFVNWALMVGSIAVVATFQSTVSIGNAFGVAFIFVMIVSTLLVTLVQLVVWEVHPLLALLFCAFFLLLEGFPASALLYKVPHGAWFPLVLGAVVMAVSFLWHFGSTLRMRHSLATTQQLSAVLKPGPSGFGELILADGDQRPVSRVPGVAVYHSESLKGLPQTFCHLIRKLPAAHQTVVFLTIRQVPLPSVSSEERCLIRSLHLPGMFQVVARYGYQDIVDLGPTFISELATRMAALVRFQALYGKAVADSAAEIPAGAPDRAHGQEAASPPPGQAADGEARNVQAECAAEVVSSGSHGRDMDPNGDSANLVLQGPEAGVVYILGSCNMLAKPGSNLLRRVLLESLFPFLVKNSHSPTAKWRIPLADVIEVGLTIET